MAAEHAEGSWARQPRGLRWALQEFRVGPGPCRGSRGLSCRQGDSRGGTFLSLLPVSSLCSWQDPLQQRVGGPGFPSAVRYEPKPGRLASQEARIVERHPLVASGD